MLRTKIVTIPGTRSEQPGQRDNGKTFLITEMPSRPAEAWGSRAFLALAHSSVDLPREMFETRRRRPDGSDAPAGMIDVARVARLVGHIQFPELAPLLDELMTACVRFISDPKNPNFTRALMDAGLEGDDIEEVATRHYLRAEVLDLHVGFFLPAMILDLIALGSTMTETTATTVTTPTSRRRSGR